MKKIISIIITIISIGFLTGCNLSLTFDKDKPDTPIGGETDEHGCMLMAGYTWCEAKQKCLREWEEVCDPNAPIDTLSELIIRIKAYNNEESGISFLTSEAEFKWMVEGETETESLTIQGESLSADGISDEAYQKLVNFFKDNGFEMDPYNAMAGTISGQDGFKKGDLVCTVAGGATGYKEAEGQWIPPEPNKKDVEIKCGVLDEGALPVISKETLIRQALAQKHGKKVSQVQIAIDKETETHVRGSVTFLPVGEISSSGYFLAAKVSGEWKIVIDGHGVISCSLVRPYNFPEDMIEDCWEG